MRDGRGSNCGGLLGCACRPASSHPCGNRRRSSAQPSTLKHPTPAPPHVQTRPASRCGRGLLGRRAAFPAPALASGQPSPLRDAGPLELRDRAEDVHLQLACRCRRVDALVERHECDPNACSSSSNKIKWRRFRPSRSRRQQTRTSNLRRFASVMSRSSAGRRSFAPLTPESTYSTVVHPRASP